MSIPGTTRYNSNDAYLFTDAWQYRRFSASLPTGSYTAVFIDEAGNQAWPTFVEEVWEKAPDCSGGASPGEVTIIKPVVDAAACAELMRNGGQDATLTTSDPWLHTHPGVRVGAGLGINGSDAIITTDRRYYWTGLVTCVFALSFHLVVLIF